jgi:hypothetical protein
MRTTSVASLLCIILCSVQFSRADAQAPKCEVKHQPFANGATSTGTMNLEQGSVCQFKFRFAQVNPPDSWELVEPPKSGKVVFKDDTAEYQANDGFSGEDKFAVAVFGKAQNCGNRCNRNGRFEFAVTVKPKS